MNSILDGLGTSQKIKALMAVRGITQNDLARVVGVSLGTIQNRFDLDRWGVSELKKIAAEYGIDIANII